MNALIWLWSLFALYDMCLGQEDQPQDGYIFTCPKSLLSGSNNELMLRRFGKKDAGTLEVQVFFSDYSSAESPHTKLDYEIHAGQTDSFLNLPLYKFDYNVRGRIQINGTFGDYNISGTDFIFFVSPKTNIIVIQTDKPIYKPGQQVKFRVVKVNKDFRASGKEKDNVDIFVEDPRGTRLFQFKDVKLGSGMVQKEFPLSEEPVKGNWRITVSDNDTTESVTFEVKEYVLPKFDVSIKFPSFVLESAKEIPVEICAKYTYGKPVVGVLNLNASLDFPSYSTEKYPTLLETIKLDGCSKYTLNVTLIQGGPDYSYRSVNGIIVVANVIEDGTGVESSETQHLQRQYYPMYLMFSSDEPSFFKPGLPYSGKLKVSNPDSDYTPAADEPIEICATVSKKRVIATWWATKKIKYCKNYTSDADGIIRYSIPPQNMDAESVTVEVKSLRFSKESNSRNYPRNIPSNSRTLYPFYSPSGSFIQLEPVPQPVECRKKQTFKVLFTSKENTDFQLYYQITKQADVVQTNMKKVNFEIENDVSSKYENDEKLINSQETQVDPPISNVANAEENYPAAAESKFLPLIGEVELDVEIDPSFSPTFHILVYYVRNDRETVADSQQINVEKCFKNKVEFAFGDEVKQPGLKTSLKITASPNSLCGIKTIDKSVSLLNSDDQLTKENIFQRIERMDTKQYYTRNLCNENGVQPGLYSSKKTILPPITSGGSSSNDDSLSAFQRTGMVVISDLVLFTRPCVSYGGYGGYGGFGGGGVSVYSAIPGDQSPAAVPPVAKATKSVSEVRTFFPETWLFDMEMTGPDGVYIAKERLPDTITQWIGSAVCLSPKDGLGISDSTTITAFQSFFLDYTLPVSVIRGEVFVVVITIFSYADGTLPLSVKLDTPEGFELVSDSIDGDICLLPDTSESLKIKLKGTTVGKINITVRAETSKSTKICDNMSDVLSGSISKDAITKSLDVEAEGFPSEKVYNNLFCPSDEENGLFESSISLEVPDDVVSDSERAFVDFTGNVLGKAIVNLNSLVELPTGCGEQNMVKFTPNYLVLDFFKDIGMFTKVIENEAKQNLNKGYQREMTYRRSDGSFSAFGEIDREGSMFLTAFVLRSFYEAKRYVTIDDEVLLQMQRWIVSKQESDGCFPDVGKIIDMELQGGIEEEESSGAITAYVLASLLISQYGNRSVINAAFDCLDENTPTNPYSSLLYAYAEALGNETEKASVRLDELKGSVNRTGGMEYFIIDSDFTSNSIEANAYAVLTILKIGGATSDALPFIRYLTSHLNPRGGFTSTQDTCVGLDALSQFAKLVYRDPLSLEITSSGDLEKSIEITADNKLLVQRYKATKIPGQIKIQAKGTGCGLIQTSVRYNTKSSPEMRNFLLDVKGKCSNPDCKKAVINVIVSYLPQGLKAGMTVLEIKLITGTVPVKESLESLISNKSNQIQRYDVENNKVIIYFSEMSNTGEVFSFDIERVVEVENSQPGTAEVYDYYANENSASTGYKIQGLSSDTGSRECRCKIS